MKLVFGDFKNFSSVPQAAIRIAFALPQLEGYTEAVRKFCSSIAFFI
jgi:hypothetical protein